MDASECCHDRGKGEVQRSPAENVSKAPFPDVKTSVAMEKIGGAKAPCTCLCIVRARSLRPCQGKHNPKPTITCHFATDGVAIARPVVGGRDCRPMSCLDSTLNVH